jgi:hypothetical protein
LQTAVDQKARPVCGPNIIPITTAHIFVTLTATKYASAVINPIRRVESMVRSTTPALLALLLVSCAASAAELKTGLWKETSYQVDASGKRTPCVAAFCGGLIAPNAPDFSKICVATGGLESVAENRQAQMAMLMKSRSKNCKETEPNTKPTGRQSGLVCDDVSISQTVSYPDDRHFAYETTIKSAAASGHGSGGMTMVSEFEWLSPDCTGANSDIGPAQQRP